LNDFNVQIMEQTQILMLQPDAFCEHNAAKCDSGRDFVPESPGIRCPGESRDPHFVPESPGIRCPGESRDPLPRPRLLYNTLEMAITLQPSDAIFGYSGREKGRKRSEGKGRGRQRGLSGRWRGLGRR